MKLGKNNPCSWGSGEQFKKCCSAKFKARLAAQVVASSGAQSILRWSRETPQSIAVVEGGQAHTYAQTAEHLAKFTKVIASEGLQPGMIVGIEFSGGRYVQLLLMLACEVIGATHFSLEVQADPTARRCDMFLVQHPGEGLSSIGQVLIIDQDFITSVMQTPVTSEDIARLGILHGPDVGVRIAKTSGTTGSSKYMLKTRRIIDRIINSYDNSIISIDGPYIYSCLYSPTMGGVYIDIIRALIYRNKIIFESGLEDFISNTDNTNTYALLLPLEANRLVDLCKLRKLSLNLYYADITGAGIEENFKAELNRYVSSNLINIYSSNETAVIASREECNRYSVSLGVDIEIVDDEGRAKPLGEAGIIKVRSACIVEGYLWNEELTVKHFRDGWFLMSDIGYIPEPGKLVVVGRYDDMLNIGGAKIAPYPIEQYLKSIAGIKDVIVLRLENKFGVGRLCVVIEREQEQDDSTLISEISLKMAKTGRAYDIHFERHFPRTNTGKVQRKVLQSLVESVRLS